MTASDNAMVIFHYVPIEEAVNNGRPTETEFYRAADLENGRGGWRPGPAWLWWAPA